MVNSDKFGKRLERILDEYDLTASAFADAIEVGAATISHILSGRNKPSLDFVMKVVNTYPEVNLYWLLNGKGVFPSHDEQTVVSQSKKITENTKVARVPGDITGKVIQAEGEASDRKKIKRIVIFYDDGTFESYKG